MTTPTCSKTVWFVAIPTLMRKVLPTCVEAAYATNAMALVSRPTKRLSAKRSKCRPTTENNIQVLNKFILKEDLTRLAYVHSTARLWQDPI